MVGSGLGKSRKCSWHCVVAVLPAAPQDLCFLTAKGGACAFPPAAAGWPTAPRVQALSSQPSPGALVKSFS